MGVLTEQLAFSLKYICICKITQDQITNGRWACDPRDPTTVFFQADALGSGNIDSGTIASDVILWAERTNSVWLGTETLSVQGAIQCHNKDCVTSPVSPAGSSNLWIIGIVAGIIVLVIIVAVAAVIVLWLKRYRSKSFRLVGSCACHTTDSLCNLSL